MNIQINPQEIYLLERYTALDYFGEMRDTWAEMVEHVESCLASFMQNLSPKYRSTPLPEQPDIVWGGRVLPNFRDTLQGLNTGFILLAHGDVRGFGYAHGPCNDFKGQMEFSTAWMSKEDYDLYDSLLFRAQIMAANITATEEAHWQPLELSNYSGPLVFPDRWPVYRINKNISVRTGEKTGQSGIYVPAVENSCPEFLSINYKQAPSALVLMGFEDILDPRTGGIYDHRSVVEKRECVWYLVERTDDLDGVSREDASAPLRTRRIAAGDTCPETGFYFTPARPESRRIFQKGEVMPHFDTAYGTTIWQWDSNQN